MPLIVQCRNKHYYDAEKYKECPHCGQTVNTGETIQDIKKKKSDLAQQYIKSFSQEFSEQIRQPEQHNKEYFVAGWLICISGPDLGHCFNLFKGYNTVGQSYGNNICMEKDKKIDQDVHFSVIYDNRKNKFYLLPESHTLSTYLNGQKQKEASQIQSGNIIKAGESEFEFIAYCRENKKWFPV